VPVEGCLGVDRQGRRRLIKGNLRAEITDDYMFRRWLEKTDLISGKGREKKITGVDRFSGQRMPGGGD